MIFGIEYIDILRILGWAILALIVGYISFKMGVSYGRQQRALDEFNRKSREQANDEGSWQKKYLDSFVDNSKPQHENTRRVTVMPSALSDEPTGADNKGSQQHDADP